VSLQASLYQALDQGDLGGIDIDRVVQAPVAVRTLAVQVLASAPHSSWLAALERLLQDPAAEVQVGVMLAAGRLGASADALVVKGLQSPQPEVRRAAAWAACHTQGKASEPLLALVAGEKDLQVLEVALANLWRLPEGTWERAAISHTGHQAAEIRRAVAYSLARRGSQARVAALARLSQDSDPIVRATAINGFRRGDLGKPEQQLLLAALDDPDQRVLVAACSALTAQAAITVTEKAAATVVSLWGSRAPHLVAAAIGVARSHAEVGLTDDLMILVTGHEPWLASLALQALVARRDEAAVKTAAAWLQSDELWQRRAAARVSGDNQEVMKKILTGKEAAVQLAWLEGISAERVPGLKEKLWQVVRTAPDPAVRSQALDMLHTAGAVTAAKTVLDLYDSWQTDTMADARASALLIALELVAGEQEREAVLNRAGNDSDPVVHAMVARAARAAGHEIPARVRAARHPDAWYRDLVAWSRTAHWLDVVTVRGTFRMRLDAQTAPITSREVYELAESGFYDGLRLHRVVPNFVVQGGDPRGDGWGGPGFALADEPSLQPYIPGRVGIATSGPNTGGCQLFVTTMPADHLTGHYTNFAEVARGQDVIDRLRVGDTIRRIEVHSGEELPPPSPTLLGTVEWHELAELDGWLAEKEQYLPDATAIEQLQAAVGFYRVVTVLGTWCGDSRREVPRLVQVLEEIGTGAFTHWMIGVDRSKRVDEPELPPQLLSDGVAERVPTIIVLDDIGQELGRVVETAEEPLESFLVQVVAPFEGW
jgi:cyclophilin family peptidyl-prolyl cis-trans isomerase/phosphohistidine phosphatase SixA